MVNKLKVLFVINQLSGSVAQYHIEKLVQLYLDLERYEYELYHIDHYTSPVDFKSLFEKAHDVVVAVGGDGTMLEIGKRIINTHKVLAFIPIGSGNGLATHLGYKPRKIEAAFEVLNQMKTTEIDAVKINEDYFFSNFGCGIDAQIAKRFKTRRRRGLLAYAWLTLAELPYIKPKTIKYKIQNQSHQVTAYFFNIFNSNMFGYNVGLVPNASALDGLLDLVYIERFPKWKLPWVAIAILLRRPHWIREYKHQRVTEITILRDQSFRLYQIDGDPQKSTTDLQISIIPQALKVITP